MQKTLLTLLFATVAGPAAAAAIDLSTAADPYQTCVNAIDMSADDAFEAALEWRDRGGGVPAETCAALALISLDQPGEAASRLDALARRSDAGQLDERAMLLAQSGNAWLLANQPESAEAAFSAALKLTPRDPELWVDRARARAVLQNWEDAEKDLDNALVFDKSKPETYVLRASARKAQQNIEGYKTDIDAALALDPTFPEALVERGGIKLEAGDVDGARADWVQVLVRAPESPAADAVRDQIQLLEVHEDR